MLAPAHPRGGDEGLALNCGYGRGYSALEAIETLSRVSAVDFEARLAGRRPGGAPREV